MPGQKPLPDIAIMTSTKNPQMMVHDSTESISRTGKTRGVRA